MPSFAATAAVAGLAGLAAAAPWGQPGSGSGNNWGSQSSTTTSCAGTTSTATAFPTPVSTGAFFKFPLSNGFPNIANPSNELNAIQLAAHGTLSNQPPPPSLSQDTLTSLRLIAFNEIFEVAFFTSLLQNITNHVPGYEVPDGMYNTVINELIAAQAQEELHTLSANGPLAAFGAQPIQPCQYKFPSNGFSSSIALASTFTDVVLSVLPNVQRLLAVNGDSALVPLIGSVIGQEGEQNGFYRFLEKNGDIPSALPFLTAGTREFAFSALNQNFIVPGSCPNINTINLPIFGTLNVLTANIKPVTQDLQFSFASNSTKSADGLSLVYINQQNVPIVEPIKNASYSNGVVTFTATFPYDQFEMNGLTIAAVTNSAGPFVTADDVAKKTLFGPGLIEIN